jgi:hydrogenase maturation factor
MKTAAASDEGITADIKAYEKLLPTLEGNVGNWVLIHQEELVNIFDTSEEAAAEAVRRFGRGPFLIRQIGAPPMVLPASLMYGPIYG